MTNPPFFIPAVIFLVISLPLVAGWVPRNRFYGIRTQKTLSDDRIWYAVNRRGGLLITTCSLVYLGLAAVVPFSKDIMSPRWWTHMAGFLLPLLVAFAAVHFYSKRL